MPRAHILRPHEVTPVMGILVLGALVAWYLRRRMTTFRV